MKKVFTLTRRRHTPGEVVMRFGDWRKGEPTVLLDNRKWRNFGKPETITVEIVSPS